MKNKKEKRKRGFTLIELLAVIIILEILLVIAVPAGTTYNDAHKDKEYARIDDPANGRPGYFTLKSN